MREFAILENRCFHIVKFEQREERDMPESKERVGCSWCKKEFQVTRYGRGIPCPHCKKRLDIFPDPLFQIDTEWGSLTVSVLQPGFVEKLQEEVKEELGKIVRDSLSPLGIIKKIIGK